MEPAKDSPASLFIQIQVINYFPFPKDLPSESNKLCLTIACDYLSPLTAIKSQKWNLSCNKKTRLWNETTACHLPPAIRICSVLGDRSNTHQFTVPSAHATLTLVLWAKRWKDLHRANVTGLWNIGHEITMITGVIRYTFHQENRICQGEQREWKGPSSVPDVLQKEGTSVKVRKAKAQLELNLTRDTKNNRSFYSYLSRERKTQERIPPWWAKLGNW